MNKVGSHYLILCFALLMISCSPSVRLLQQYEFANQLQDVGLQIPLENKEEDILLLQKYEQHRKAERLAKKVEAHNSGLRQAFTDQYSVSPIHFVEEQRVDKDKPYLIFKEITRSDDKRDKQVLVLQIWEKNELMLSQETDGIESFSRTNYAVKQLNRKIERYATKSK